jgi:hypothetical protein
MKKYITYAMAAFFATVAISIASPDKENIISKEKGAWQTFKDKKSDEFKKFLHADFYAAYSDGIYTMQQEIDSMKTWDLKSFSFSDVNVVFPDADTATITYKVMIEGTSGGKDASGTYNAGSVWRKHNGEWRAAFHTNVKEEKAASQ